MKKWSVLLIVVLVLAAAVPALSGAQAQDDPLRVAVVMPSTINDLAFSQSMYDALVAIQTEMGGEEKMEFVFSM